MIRGVSRYSVEVKGTGNPYFERAICFVRPQFARAEKMDLHRAAQELMNRLSEDVEESQEVAEKAPGSGGMRWFRAALPLVVSGLTGAAAAFLICLLV